MKKQTYITALLISLVLPVTSQAFDQSSPADSLVVDTDGNVGVGTNAPEEIMHLKKSVGRTKLLVEDTTAVTATRGLLELKNMGGPSFRLVNTRNDSVWVFSHINSGEFIVSRGGTGGNEFKIAPNGQFSMNAGTQNNFDLRPSGDLIIPNGSVTANGVSLTSSRSSKTDIEPIDSKKILKNLNKLGIAEWRYKKADKNDRHISPMAEDFYSLFKLGPDNKHINPNDLASVAIVAAKELQKENTALKSETSALKKRLDSLEKLVTNLASSENTIDSTGKKVTLNMK